MNWGFLYELRKKAMHVMILLVIILFVILEKGVSRQIALLTLTFLLLLLALEYLRLELNIDLPFLNQFVRAKEERKMHSAIYFLAAVIITLAVFDFRIALAALLMTTFGDMSASIVGNRYGKTLIFKNKTLKGCGIELIINLIVGFLVLQNIYIIIAMALSATVVETFVNELEDNLFVPLTAGFLGQLILLLI